MKHTLTDLDNTQITRYSYDDEMMAQRVVITGISGLNEAMAKGLENVKVSVDTSKLEAQLGSLTKYMEDQGMQKQAPVASTHLETPEVRIEYVDRPVIVEKQVLVEVEKQVLVRDVEYREIEKPVIVREIEVVRVEVPVSSSVDQKKNQVLEIIQLVLLAAIAVALFLK